jgi:hypothetical protein
MGDLTEREIFDRMKSSFREAADISLRLARGERGPLYRQLRAHLGLIEGTLRQAAWWREDTRWLYVVPCVARAHQEAGRWLREKGPRTGEKFAKLSEFLRFGEKAAEDLRLKRTERLGLILPRPQAPPHRETRPVTVKTPGGLIVPGTVH